jgi:ABC-type dipeptide/oligopeptide/nickel transport system permease component
MLKYILNRIIYLLPVLFIMSVVVFSFIHLIPGDPVDAILGLNASEEARAEVRKSLGLDRNIVVQYLSWIGGVVSGDFGESVTTGEPVLKLILEKLPATLLLALASILVSVFIAIFAGTIAAERKGTWTDMGILILALAGISVPVFWIGILAVLVFSVAWPIFPSIGYVSPLQDPIAALRHLTLPALCMGAALAGAIARMTRSEMIEQLGKDYIVTARAKGLSPREVTYRHALRNSLITVVTFTGLEFGTLLGGAIIVETIFAWPGLGRTVIQAIFSRDYPMVQGIVLFLAFFFVFVNLLVDISYTFLNPQIRLGNDK